MTKKLFIILGILTLIGCGQKGALYLPDEPRPPLTQSIEQGATK